MKSTTVVSLTKIAQMLTSRIGRKPLLLALVTTLACLRTATAMKNQFSGPADPADQAVTTGSVSEPAGPDGGPVKPPPIQTGGANTPRSFYTVDNEAIPSTPNSPTSSGTAESPSDVDHQAHDLALNQARSNVAQAGDVDHSADDGQGGKSADLLSKREPAPTQFQKYWKEYLAGATLVTTGAAFGIGTTLKNVQGTLNDASDTLPTSNMFVLVIFAALLFFGILCMAFSMFSKPGANNKVVLGGTLAIGVGAATMIAGIFMGAHDVAIGAENGGAKHVADVILNPFANGQLTSALVVAGGFLFILFVVLGITIYQTRGKGGLAYAKNISVALGSMCLVGLGGTMGHVITKCSMDGFDSTSIPEGGLALSISLIAMFSFFGFLALTYLLFSNDKNGARFGSWGLKVGMFGAVVSSVCLTVGFSEWMHMGNEAPSIYNHGGSMPMLATVMFAIAGSVLFIIGLMFMAKKCIKHDMVQKFFGN